MFKIEKYLIDFGFKLKKEYSSGVIVYSNDDKEPSYSIDVALFTKHNPFVWEMTIHNPYAITLLSYKQINKENESKSIHALTDDLIDCAFEFEAELKNIDNPWEVIE